MAIFRHWQWSITYCLIWTTPKIIAGIIWSGALILLILSVLSFHCSCVIHCVSIIKQTNKPVTWFAASLCLIWWNFIEEYAPHQQDVNWIIKVSELDLHAVLKFSDKAESSVTFMLQHGKLGCEDWLVVQQTLMQEIGVRLLSRTCK